MRDVRSWFVRTGTWRDDVVIIRPNLPETMVYGDESFKPREALTRLEDHIEELEKKIEEIEGGCR